MIPKDELFNRLWNSFSSLNPQAELIHQLLADRGEQIVHDHIAFRTFDDPRVDIDVLARPFLAAGYVAKGSYEFPIKHLIARHYEHADSQSPKIFISQLNINEMSKHLQQSVQEIIDQIPNENLNLEDFCMIGHPWKINFSTYQRLVQESEYAGWLYAFGYCANHFAILVNELTTIINLQELNRILIENNFKLNSAGGEIKGSPELLLEQSSTVAPEIDVEFTDGVQRIPSCYYEFAKRYKKNNGQLFTGFIAQSADKIFQSTDRRKT